MLYTIAAASALSFAPTVNVARPSNGRADVRMVESWYDAGARLGGAAAMPAAAAAAASTMPVGGKLDVSSSAILARLSDAKKAKGGRNPGGYANTLLQEGLNRIQDPVVGVDSRGPPLTMPSGLGWDTSTEPKNKADMIELAKKLNPVVGFWDPLNIVDNGMTTPESIGWWRHAEIKHGRVAMAGFVGYCVHANGIYFPWAIQKPLPFSPITSDLPTINFADISAAGGPADQWDALPTAAKVQILCVIGFLEMWGETSIALEAAGQKHYVRGGKPGFYPGFQGLLPHPVTITLILALTISFTIAPRVCLALTP